MVKGNEPWNDSDADDFWARPTVAQRLAAKRELDRKAFEMGWSRIFYVTAAALVLVTWALMTFR